MVEKTSMTNFDKLNKIINSNGGYITGKNVKEAHIPTAIFSQFIKKYNLIKQCPGFYSLTDWIRDDYFIFQYQYPKLIYSFYLAAYLHGLSDYCPTFIEVTAPKNYRPFPLPRSGVILHTDTRDETYNLGVSEVVTSFGNKIRVYDIEKTVCDFIRNREKLDSESFVKCVTWYKRRKDKNINKLFQYANIMKIKDKVMSIMEVILNED